MLNAYCSSAKTDSTGRTQRKLPRDIDSTSTQSKNEGSVIKEWRLRHVDERARRDWRESSRRIGKRSSLGKAPIRGSVQTTTGGLGHLEDMKDCSVIGGIGQLLQGK